MCNVFTTLLIGQHNRSCLDLECIYIDFDEFQLCYFKEMFIKVCQL